MVAFFLSDTRETVCGLTTASVLLRQLYCDFLQDRAHIALKSSEQSSITIDDDESKFLIILKQIVEHAGLKFV